jgi:sirohydrochlorin ferrochelatase
MIPKPLPELPNQIPVQGAIPAAIEKQLLGIIILDHGSKRDESNVYVQEIARLFQEQTDFHIVEPAHMELASPDIDTAYHACVQRGAKYIVVHPYFLAPGRHWHEHIPELARMAAQKHPQTACVVTPPLGIHDAMVDIMATRIENALSPTSEITHE